MRFNAYICLAILVVLLSVSSITAWGQGNYSAGELDELLGPIALYPDPLLAQIFPAATFPDQLQAASRFSGGTSAIDKQSWDVSVKAVAHYPEVLDMMVKNPDWTVAIGQAYANQPTEVMKSVQRLRAKAEANGNLASNAQQQVTTSNGGIAIEPAQPQYVYVPQYNSQAVYTEPAPSYGGASPWVTFGAGMLIGAWLNNTINWHNSSIYYHGWHGSGWINNARPYVDLHNNRYVNNNFNRPVRVNPNINNRNIQQYRNQLQRNVGTYRPPMRTQPRPAAGTRPSAPGARPTQPGARPAMPKVPSVRPTVPGSIGAGGQRPGMPRVPSARPARPGAGAGGYHPSAPSVRPSAPRTRPSGTYRPSGGSVGGGRSMGGGGRRGGGGRGGGGRRGR